MSHDLLLEIGVEELPASFVDGALEALPKLATKLLEGARLGHAGVRVLGTPRRLALLVRELADAQQDLEEELTGPPVRAAFQNGQPTKAAEAFAQKLGVPVGELRQVETPKGAYLAGTRKEKGRRAKDLLPDALAKLVLSIPFRKSMRWSDLDITFGRPIAWIVALLGTEVLPVTVGPLQAGRESRGHRFLAPGVLPIASAGAYEATLAGAHVVVDPEARRASMNTRLAQAAQAVGATVVPDDFLVQENLHLVEEPHVVVGGFAPEFLELPERVIVEVAKGHQRYFCARGEGGALLPRYLSVVGTANKPENVVRGGDRVMRARLADAKFFFDTDLAVPLAERREKLGGIVFQKRLGTVLDKVVRVERLVRELGLLLMLPEPTILEAASGAHLAKCDLVSLMVGEFPELQGEMGRAYALRQGVAPEVADVLRDHYAPKGASDAVAPTAAAALVALADRLDTLVGCFAVGLVPTGAADPYALRRAAIAVLRTLLGRGFDLRLSSAVRAAYDQYHGTKLDLGADELSTKLLEFLKERLRGVLADRLPEAAAQAALAVAWDRPLDALARAEAMAKLDEETRAKVGEVFKRATNIAASADANVALAPPAAPEHPSETALYQGYVALRAKLEASAASGDYATAFAAIAGFAPLLHEYFLHVFVMADDLAVRAQRLRLMLAIRETCSSLARLDLLAQG